MKSLAVWCAIGLGYITGWAITNDLGWPAVLPAIAFGMAAKALLRVKTERTTEAFGSSEYAVSSLDMDASPAARAHAYWREEDD